MDELKKNHQDIIEEFVKLHQVKNYSFMLTVSRDGEIPARSIYNFSDAISAVESYNKYTDWGFAKEYLTVKLYEPNGKIQEKILKRPAGGSQGDCTFVREDYIKAGNIIKSVKNNIDDDSYNKIVKDFALLFSQDNQRFDEKRFFIDTEYKQIKENNG
jgi:hypothetical protein